MSRVERVPPPETGFGEFDSVRVVGHTTGPESATPDSPIPSIGDIGTIVHLVDAPGRERRYIVESVAPDGRMRWLVEFGAADLSFLGRPV